MTAIEWDAIGERIFETGVDRGVLYTSSSPGVPWNGLVSVSENPSGGGTTPRYYDGQKYLNTPSSEEYEATIEAYTYPDEFGACDGTMEFANGLFVTHQPRKPFNFTYRTLVGNDVKSTSLGYKIHLIYGALATPSKKDNKTMSESPEMMNFSWDITLLPPDFAGYKPSGHLIVDSRRVSAMALSGIEDALYGTGTTDPRMPLFDELAEMVLADPDLIVVDNGDGTYTVTNTTGELTFPDSDSFQIDSAAAINEPPDTFRIVYL